MLESSIELEGLRGTVYGLENWVGMWERERNLLEMQGANMSHRRWGWKPKRDLCDDGGKNDVLIDGIGAWIRGWKDVEEGFRIRAQERNQRREIMRSRENHRTSSQGNRSCHGNALNWHTLSLM